MAESIQQVPSVFPANTAAPTAREWRLHLSLFALTVISTTLAGIRGAILELPVSSPPLSAPLDYLLYIPHAYLNEMVALASYSLAHPQLIVEGLTFSAALLLILFSHEMGHYLACRYYGVNATLPFFIPAPPLFLAGTFGAFIKIRTPISSRRALFDIGLAGPLAGFVVAVPLAVVGVLTMEGAPTLQGSGFLIFNDPPLIRFLGKFLGVHIDPNAIANPYYMAAWIGLLVTSLNLMPVGQLDGGHGTFSIFGQRAHQIIGRVAFVLMVITAVLGIWWHGSPSGVLYAVLLGIMLRVRHPPLAVMEPLGIGRTVIAIITLIVFMLCFTPFPITMT